MRQSDRVSPPNIAYGLAWLALMALSFILRVGWWGVGSFASDEARLSWLALRMARGGDFITSGITSSAGARNLPASVYAFVPPYLLSPDPLWATLFVGVLNALAVMALVWVAYRLCRMLGAEAGIARWASLGAGLYVAVNPFAVFFSRNIWTQNLLLPMATLLLACLVFARTHPGRGRSVALFGATFIAGIGFQIHLAGISFLLMWGVAILYGRFWRNGRDRLALASGVLLSALVLAPFIVTALTTTPEYISEYTQALSGGERAIDAQALVYMARVAVGYDWNYLALGDLDTVGEATPLIAVGAGMLLLAGIGAWAWAMRHKQAQGRYALVLVALTILTPVVAFTAHSTPPRLHYMLGALAGLPLLVALAIAYSPRRVRYAVLGLVMALGGVWAIQSGASLMRLDGRTAPNGMGTTLQSVRDPALLALAGIPDGVPLLIHTQSSDIATRGEPATWAVLLWDAYHTGRARIVAGWQTLIIPDGQTTLLTDADGMPAWEEVQFWAQTAGASIQIFNPMATAPPIYRADLPPARAIPEAYTRLDTPIAFESGLTLIAYQKRIISGRFRITLVYRVDRLPPAGRTIQQFTHLRVPDNAEGAPDFISDVALDGHNWRVGDTLVSIADFFVTDLTATGQFTADTLLTTPFIMDSGQYRLDDGVRFTRADGMGDHVRLVLE